MSQYSGLQEAIAHVEKSKAQALGIEILPIPTPDHKRWVRVGQELKEVDISPGLRRLRIDTLQDMIALAALHYSKNEGALNHLGFYVTPAGVQLIFNVFDGRESAYLEFADTKEHSVLSEAIGDPAFSPAELRAVLRYELSETMTEEFLSKLAKQVGQVTFESNGVNSTNLDRRGESLGASVQRQVNSDHGLPDETLYLDVRRYANPDIALRTRVKVLIDPDHANRRWYFRPVEQSWSDYKDEAVRSVRETLMSGLKHNDINIPVLMGKYTTTDAKLPAVTK